MNDFERFRAAITDDDDTITVEAFGELDFGSVDGLQEIVGRCLDVPGVRRMVVNMSQVTFCDCAALGVLVQAKETALRRRMSFELIEAKEPIVTRLLSLTGTDAVFGLSRTA